MYDIITKEGKEQKMDFGERLNREEERIEDKDIIYIKQELKAMQHNYEEKKKKISNLNYEEFEQRLEQDLKKIIKGPTNIAKGTRSDLCLFKTLKYLKENPNELLEMIDINRIEEFLKSEDYYVYTPDIRKNVKTILQDLIPMYLSEQRKSKREELINGGLKNNIEERKKFLNYCKNFSSKYRQQFHSNMMQYYKYEISKAITLLDDMGVLEKNTENNNRRLKFLDLEELQIDYKREKGKQTKVQYVTDLTNPLAIKNLKLKDLTMMNSFYMNRVEKSVHQNQQVRYIINKLNLQSNIENGKTIDIDDSKIRNLLVQYNFLQNIARYDIINEANKLEETNQNINSVNNLKEEHQNKIVEQYEKIKQDYEEEYNQFYKDSNFVKDLNKSMLDAADIENLYKQKDYAIHSALMELLDDDTNYNWGISSQYDKEDNMVVISVDLPGFNQNVSLHVRKSKLLTLIKKYKNTEKLPIYKGKEDFQVQINGKKGWYTTQILLPLPKKQKDAFNKRIANEPEKLNHKLVEHLDCIINGKILKREEKEINIATGEITDVESNKEK